MVDSTLFIGALIVAITQVIKYIFHSVSGAITILVAMVVGGLVAFFAPALGIASMSIAQGVLIGLAAAGVHTVASSVNSKS